MKKIFMVIEVPTKNGSLVIQWDAEMVRLPYNVKVSESYDPDVSLREYAGSFDADRGSFYTAGAGVQRRF